MYGEIDDEELHALLADDEDVRVVDIRSPSAFRRGHIPDSENVPFEELTDRIEAVASADRVVTVCPKGEASVQAARLIGSFDGFSGRVESLSTGISGWSYDLETGDRGGGTVDGGAEPGDGEEEAPF
ncbi:rhodanese-like domain-containing protein [Halobacteriales archaeon QS_4_69_225]|nr:MAG: rhodanese-like domain-containing protein [Halobacteriales archaeon QS_4_69_225]